MYGTFFKPGQGQKAFLDRCRLHGKKRFLGFGLVSCLGGFKYRVCRISGYPRLFFAPHGEIPRSAFAFSTNQLKVGAEVEKRAASAL